MERYGSSSRKPTRATYASHTHSHQSNSKVSKAPRPQHQRQNSSLFSRVKNFIWGNSDKETESNTEETTTPRLVRYTASPVRTVGRTHPRGGRARYSRHAGASLSDIDLGEISEIREDLKSSTRDPNEELKEFFEQKGDGELSRIEMAGVLSLIQDAVSRNESLIDFKNIGSSTIDGTSILDQSRSLLVSTPLASPMATPNTSFNIVDRAMSPLRTSDSPARPSARTRYDPIRSPMYSPWSQSTQRQDWRRRSLSSRPSGLAQRASLSPSRPAVPRPSVSSQAIERKREQEKDGEQPQGSNNGTAFQPGTRSESQLERQHETNIVDNVYPPAVATKPKAADHLISSNRGTFGDHNAPMLTRQARAHPPSSLRNIESLKRQPSSQSITETEPHIDTNTSKKNVSFGSYSPTVKVGFGHDATEVPANSSTDLAFKHVNPADNHESSMETDQDDYIFDVPKESQGPKMLSSADVDYIEAAKSSFTF